jgi:hypothetical protein
MTPEGKVKASVNKVLSKYKKQYTHMPVPYGYGQSTLDYLICVNGYFLAIETKAPGKKPTNRQNLIAEKIESAGGVVLVIDDASATHELEAFMERATHAPSPSLNKT